MLPIAGQMAEQNMLIFLWKLMRLRLKKSDFFGSNFLLDIN